LDSRRVRGKLFFLRPHRDRLETHGAREAGWHYAVLGVRTHSATLEAGNRILTKTAVARKRECRSALETEDGTITAELTPLQQEPAAYQTRERSLEEEVRRLAGRLSVLEEELATRGRERESAARVLEEREDLRRTVSELERHRTGLMAAQAQLRDDLEESRQFVARLSAEASRAERERETATTLNRDLQEQLRTLKNQLKTVATERDALQREIRMAEELYTQMRQIAGRVDHLEEGLDRYGDRTDALEERMDRHTEHAHTLEKRVDRQAERTDALEKQVDRHTEHTHALEKRVDRQAERANGLEDEMAQHAARVYTLEEQGDRHNGRMTATEGTLRTHQRRLDDIGNQVQAISQSRIWRTLVALSSPLNAVLRLLRK
jgi:chromosome segregation ATPase